MESYFEQFSKSILNIADKISDTVGAIETSICNFFNCDDNSIKIVILSCENNKFYLESTINIKEKINYYLGANNNTKDWCHWLKMHKPRAIYTIKEAYDIFDEDKYVLYMMYLFGIENVRGGSFKEVNLSSAELVVLEKIISKYYNEHVYKKTNNNKKNKENESNQPDQQNKIGQENEQNEAKFLNNKVGLRDSIIYDYYQD